MTSTLRFQVAVFNRASITTLVVFFAAIYILSAALLGGTALVAALLIATALLALIVGHMAGSAVSLDADDLRVGAGLFRRRIPYTELVAIESAARPRLGWRLNGIAFPGFALGWFSGAGGRHVFVAAGDHRHDFFRLSLHGTYDVIVSVTQGAAFERALRARIPY